MSKLSIIIPSRNEQFLQRTIEDILEKATGDIEIIAVLDGYWPSPQLKDDKRLHIIHRGEAKGMRPAINAGAAISRGDYLMKCDAHCMFDDGFDNKLIKDCEDNWVVIPTRKSLDAENWCPRPDRSDIYYEYLSYPNDPKDWGGKGLHGRNWRGKNKDPDLQKILIDDNMSFQGSCWMMPKKYFYQLDLMDADNYGPFWQEAQEIGLKAWLSGGRVVVNKKTWYAHLHKGKKYGRGYSIRSLNIERATKQTNKWLTNSAWDKQTLPFEWIIDKFWPVPEWPDNWRETIKDEV